MRDVQGTQTLAQFAQFAQLAQLAQTERGVALSVYGCCAESLHEMQMISSPDDDGCLTETGHLAASLPVCARPTTLLWQQLCPTIPRNPPSGTAAPNIPRDSFCLASVRNSQNLSVGPLPPKPPPPCMRVPGLRLGPLHQVDLKLARMVALSIMLDLVPEAVVLGAALTLPRTPFRIAYPLVQTDPDDYNEVVKQTMAGRHALDRGWYSEPLMLMNAYDRYSSLSGQAASKFCARHGLVVGQMRRFCSTVQSLRKAVAKGCVDQDSFQGPLPPVSAL